MQFQIAVVWAVAYIGLILSERRSYFSALNHLVMEHRLAVIREITYRRGQSALGTLGSDFIA